MTPQPEPAAKLARAPRRRRRDDAWRGRCSSRELKAAHGAIRRSGRSETLQADPPTTTRSSTPPGCVQTRCLSHHSFGVGARPKQPHGGSMPLQAAAAAALSAALFCSGPATSGPPSSACGAAMTRQGRPPLADAWRAARQSGKPPSPRLISCPGPARQTRQLQSSRLRMSRKSAGSDVGPPISSSPTSSSQALWASSKTITRSGGAAPSVCCLR